ncbi:cadherin-related family member 5 isoform X4 [Notamacropus eugenii]|uniref:cadherin-related family member 5 isoform X4 n=1 Tax=Notamacropus eugenii TaxID=9315 RepID=UPI003B677A40
MEASGWTLGLLPLLLLLPGAEGQTQVCSVNQTLLSVTENELPTEPLATVTAPLGQTVVVSDLSSPKDIFDIVNGQLRLTRAPDYETHTVLTAMLECKEGSEVVTTLPVIVEVLNVNDMAPVFAFSSKAWNVSENTNVGTTVISATELTAIDKDGDTIFYNLSGQSPSDADLVFSLVGVNFPALQLTRALDYEKTPILVFHLLARDTSEPAVKPSHTSTATVIIQVIPADIRPPWFLPCVFTDGRVCINAQYRAAVPTGSILTLPLTFEPGPVYAIDGDTAINEPIRYSIIAGNADDTFQIDVDSGNVTMAKAVPVPKTFNLVVQAQQKVHTGSYSVTQVTIQAVAGQLNPPRFPQALYRGWLTPGTGINVAVRDAEDPDRELRLRAEDNDFPADVPNSGLHYRITNSSAFRMSGEVVLTNAPVGTQQVLYLEAEVLDELTSENDTTTIEILVQDTKPTPPGGSPGGQEQERSTVNEMAILGGVLGALLFLTLVLMGVFIYKRNGCQKCGLSSKRGVRPAQGRQTETDLKDSGFDNKTFQVQEPSNWVALTSPSPEPGSGPQPLKDETPRRPSSGSVPPPEIKTPSPVVREAEEENRETQDEGSYRTSTEGPVRSILTKERKLEDGGYKAVWFGEDIGAQVDVVVINSPVPEEPEVAPEEPEELEMAYEEPELVLLVSEEPEELLMASVEPLLLSMVSEESKETVVVPEERPKEPDWESEGESEGEPEGEFEGESEEESEVGPEEEHEWEPEVPEESEEEPEESEEEPEESEEEPKEPMVVPAKEPEGEPEESEEHKVVSKEEPKEPMMVPEEEPKEPMVVPKEEPKEPVVVPAKEPEGEPEESEEHKVVPKEEPKEPMMVPEERPREESRGESKADENNVDKNKNGGGEVASPAPEADSPA